MTDASVSAPYLQRDADAWHAAHPCPGCPHPHYVHAHQRWRYPGAKSRDREQPDPWETVEFKAQHPGMARTERALQWLADTFARKEHTA